MWLGISASTQAEADERIPELLATPAAVRWISVEPMVGPVDLQAYLPGRVNPNWSGRADESPASAWGLDWVVCGAEAGPGARPMDEAWVRAIRDQCVAAGVSLFYKQRVDGGQKIAMPELDGRVWAQLPEVMRG